MTDQVVHGAGARRPGAVAWVVAVVAALVMALMLGGCSASESKDRSQIASIATAGRVLSEVKDELKEAGFDSGDYDIESDTGKRVIVASNWVVDSVSGDDKPVITVRKASDVEAERQAAEEEAAKKAEEEAQKAAEEEAARKAEEEAARKAEEEAARKAAEEAAAQQAAAEEAQRQAEAEAQRQAEQQAQQNVYYPNCTAAREAGAAPIYQGQPGYSTKLDRDHDGIACE